MVTDPGVAGCSCRVDAKAECWAWELGKWLFEKYHEGFLRKHHLQRRLLVFINDVNLLMHFPTCNRKNMEGIQKFIQNKDN